MTITEWKGNDNGLPFSIRCTDGDKIELVLDVESEILHEFLYDEFRLVDLVLMVNGTQLNVRAARDILTGNASVQAYIDSIRLGVMPTQAAQWILESISESDWYPKIVNEKAAVMLDTINSLIGSGALKNRDPARPPPIPKRHAIRKDAYVYLMQAGPYFKIGVSQDVKKRLKTLRTQPPFDIELICTIDTQDAYKLEDELHKRFFIKRKRGEWFTLAPADVEYIKGLSNARAE